jgi:hypothetical protein
MGVNPAPGNCSVAYRSLINAGHESLPRCGRFEQCRNYWNRNFSREKRSTVLKHGLFQQITGRIKRARKLTAPLARQN